MDNISYEPLIRDMTWSYSRLKSFDSCPYCWYLKYIKYRGAQKKQLFFSDFGTLMHQLIAEFYEGKITQSQMKSKYLTEFRKQVKGRAPNKKIFTNYFKSGLNYVGSAEKLPEKVLGVEKEVEFFVGENKFTGFIDLMTEGESGAISIVDHKSRNLKPRSKRAKPTKSDEELDDYLKQLYMYSAAVEKLLGKLPEYLCFNCFRDQVFIKEKFDKQVFDETMAWAQETIDRIATETEFRPNIEYFKCNHLCDMQDYCEYFALSKG